MEFKLGDRVGVKLREECSYGVVTDVCKKTGSLSVAIGTDRIAQVRACDCFYDEGYSRLKQEKFHD
jgi:hypothetical protein